MFPASYQTTLRAHLNESQYLTGATAVGIDTGSSSGKTLRFSQCISSTDSRLEVAFLNLQRFIVLPQLTIKVLWFSLIKYWIRQEQTGRGLNREQRRRLRRFKHQKYGYWIVAIDRTQWKSRNMFMVSLVWGTHALPMYWEVLDHVGNSELKTQKRLLKAVLHLFKNYPVLVLGDREFHSPKLADWLESEGVYFALRQKKDLHFQEALAQEYQVLRALGFKPGMSKFYEGLLCNKGDGLGPFNIAIYWKRKYRNKGPKEPWYILTNLPTLKQALDVYRCRWGIEKLFKDCKTGGYNARRNKSESGPFFSLSIADGNFL